MTLIIKNTKKCSLHNMPVIPSDASEVELPGTAERNTKKEENNARELTAAAQRRDAALLFDTVQQFGP